MREPRLVAAFSGLLKRTGHGKAGQTTQGRLYRHPLPAHKGRRSAETDFAGRGVSPLTDGCNVMGNAMRAGRGSDISRISAGNTQNAFAKEGS